MRKIISIVRGEKEEKMPKLIDADTLLTDNSWDFYDENGNKNDACIAVENAPTVFSEVDLIELEDRFGYFVRAVVEDMISGENNRWSTKWCEDILDENNAT